MAGTDEIYFLVTVRITRLDKYLFQTLLAPTGALIVTVVYYRSATQGHFLKFRAFCQ